MCETTIRNVSLGYELSSASFERIAETIKTRDGDHRTVIASKK
jgi:hypothetical protein